MKEQKNTPYIERQISLLEKYYEIDRENKEVTINFHFDKASELIVDAGGKETLFNFEVLSKIREAIDKFPVIFKVKINLYITDYEGLDPEIINEKFKDTLELTQYKARKEKSFKWLLSTLLILVGIILLFINIAGQANSWFGDKTSSEIITDIIEIAAWVFIWEAVTMIFLEPSEASTFSLQLRKKLSSINYLNNNKQTILSIHSSDLFNDWIEEDSANRVGKGMLLASSAAFMAMSFYSLYATYQLSISFSAGETDLTPAIFALRIIFNLLFGAIEFFAGLSGFSKYTHREGKLTKFHNIFAISLTVCVIYGIIISSIYGNIQTIISTIFSSIFAIMYVLSWMIDRHNKIQ